MKKYQSFIILWICITLLCSLPLMGMFIVFGILFSIIFLLKKFNSFIKKKQSKKEFLITFGIVLSSFLISSAIHYSRLEYKRYNADIIVNQVMSYKKTHGIYPESSDLKLKENSFFNGGIDYLKSKNSEEPFLSYMDSFMIFNYYYYDFKELKWKHTD